ncbi:hypothetical protein L1987_64570 [Smallanthus sonchifolius]|uniref:Uncharacterized protein n=1 Tax=Smallanthus sonchifolius TaxID=185202 RepID=A0ACB9BS38_9ASTR|nr:hypothetical protein L1987_64570 [Smallanthus sonchifolius]
MRTNRDGTFNLQFKQAVSYFLDFAYENATNIERQTIDGVQKLLIRCPCSKCKNRYYKTREAVDCHLITQGFMEDYQLWDVHGELYPDEAINVGYCSKSLPSQHMGQDVDEDLGEYTGYDQMVMEDRIPSEKMSHPSEGQA